MRQLSMSINIESLQSFAASTYGNSVKSAFEVKNPANGEIIGILPSVGKYEVDEASKLAMNVWQNTWKHTTGRERSKYISKMVKY